MKTTQTERDAWHSQALQAEQELSQLQAEKQQLQAQMQDLQGAIRRAHTQSSASAGSSTSFTLGSGPWALLAPAFVTLLAAAGYSGYRFIGKPKLLVPSHSQAPSKKGDEVVRVCMSRQDVPNYVRWLRQIRRNCSAPVVQGRA